MLPQFSAVHFLPFSAHTRPFWPFLGVRGETVGDLFGPNVARDWLTLRTKKITCKNEHVHVTFFTQFRNFAWNDDKKSFFCIVGTSWMGWGRVEWDWHMGMSYLTSLNPQLFKNIAYVGSFKHFSVQLFYMYFATQPRPSLTAVYYEPPKREQQCTTLPCTCTIL